MVANKPIVSAALVLACRLLHANSQLRNLKTPYCTCLWLSSWLVVLIGVERFSVSSLKPVFLTEVSFAEVFTVCFFLNFQCLVCSVK